MILLMVLSGILMIIPLSYPEFFFLEWIAFIPALLALRGVKKKKAFLLGWILGTIITAGTTFWLYFPLADFSGLPFMFIILLLFLLFSLVGFIYGGWAWLYKRLESREYHPLVLAVSWTGVEFLRYKFLPFYPLGFSAYTQVGFKSLLQLADLGGLFLISFIVLLINGFIYKSWLKKSIRPILPLLLVLILIFAYGGFRLNQYQNLKDQNMNIGLIPTDLMPVEKWASENIEPNLNYFLQSARKLEEKNQEIKLMVMPESGLTFDIIRNEYFRNKFLSQITDLNSYMQASGRAIINQDKPNEVYNSSFLITPEAKIFSRYNKINLLPFGEYMPFNDIIYAWTGLDLSKVISAVGSTTRGKEKIIFHINDINWQTAICSEILFPLSPILDSHLIINQSNEAWFRRGNLQEQMWTAAVFRAVENRSSVVKVGNHAFSGVILPSGLSTIKKEITDIRPFSVKAPLLNGKTVYQGWGNYVGYLSLILVIILLLIKVIKGE